MRPSRSSHVEHENRRSESHYHRSQAHSESNGHLMSNNEYRSSKRPPNSASAPSSSLIKRMKSSNSLEVGPVHNSTRIGSKDNSNNLKSSVRLNTLASPADFDQNECHRNSYEAYQLEENEALSQVSAGISADDDYDKFSETAHDLRTLIREILDAKKSKKNDDSSDQTKQFFSEKKIKGLLSLMDLKYLNRLNKFRLKEARNKLASSKDNVDQIHLQLQNFQYEVMHLQKEQKTCASFRSRDESLDLVDENKFYLSGPVPEDLKKLIIVSKDKSKALVDKNAATNEELHKLHLARLDWELKQRMSSEDELKSAEESRFRLEVEISAKRRTLGQFEPTLRNIIESAKPLVTQLNVHLQAYNMANQLTPFLSQPLYVLYIQLCAYRDAFGLSYDASIKGTVEEASEFEANQKKEMATYLRNEDKLDENDDDNVRHLDDEEEEREHRSKSKKSRYQSHQKRHSSGAEVTTSKESKQSDSFLAKHASLLQSHPLQVNLMFRYRHYNLTCNFTYFPKLDLIGVIYNIENLSYSTTIDPQFSVTGYESNIFSKLHLSSDTGFNCPNPMIEHLLRRHEIDSFYQIVPYTGYAYNWAHRIAGIEYLSAEEKPILSPSGLIRVKSSLAADSMDKTIKALIFRFQSRINLQEQLHEIHTKKSIDINKFESLLDSNEMFDNLNKVSLKPMSSIHSLERIDSDRFLKDIDCMPSKRQKLLEYFGHDMNDVENDIFDSSNFIFKLVLESAVESHHMNAYMIVPHNYPLRWPFFLLAIVTDGVTLHESDWLQELEEHLNLRLPLRVHQQATKLDESLYSTTLLLRQIYDLQCGFDVILNARLKLNSKANESLEVYSGPKCVNSFQSTSIVQGRDHSLKFV